MRKMEVVMDQVRQLAPGVMIIGRYVPTVYDPGVVGPELLRVSQNAGLVSLNGIQAYWPMAVWGDAKTASELRSPENHAFVTGSRASEWHQDTYGQQFAMMLWSNREQTEIMLLDGTILHPEPYDILLVSNTAVQHRTPPVISEDRWFFRRVVEEPDWMAK